MSYVIKTKQDGYATGRSGFTKDLQKARVYGRIVDAKNSGGSDATIKEVKIVEVEE